MDLNQQELELNQPVQTRDRSSRCHSRLADALVFAAYNPERPESSPERLTESSYEAGVSSEQPPLRAASVNMSSRSDTEQAASAESLTEIADSDHPPRRTASDIETVAMPDYKTSVSRTYSETDKAHLPANRLDIISGIGSALASPEPSLFTMAYRIKDSPSPFKASPLPPIKGSQLEQELKFNYFEFGLETSDAELDKKKHKKFDYFEIGLESEPEMESNQQVHELTMQEHQIDNNKNKKAFDYFEIDMGTSHVEPKTSDKKKNKKFVRFEIDMETSHVEHKSWETDTNLYEDLQRQDRDRVEDQLNNLDVNEKNDLKSRPVVAEEKTLNYESVQMEKNQLAETDYKNTEDMETSHVVHKSWEKENNLYEDVQIYDRDIVEDQLKNLDVNEENDLKPRPAVAEEKTLNPESVQIETNQLAETDHKEDVTQTLTKVIEKLDDLLSMSKSNIQVHPPRYPKPPNVSKGQIIVRGTKASRLRQDKLRVQNEVSDVTQDVLPAVATADKTPEQRTLVKSSLPRSRTSPPPTTKKKPVPPPALAVRETKATKLRRLKKMEEERETKEQNQEEKLKDMAFDQSLIELLHRKRTPTPTFKPAPPKPYKKPGPVSIKETRASKMRKIQENLKKTGKTVAANEIKSQDRSQKQPPPTNVKETLALKSRQARSPAPTFKPAPPKPYKKPGPVVVKETRASKLRKMPENIKRADNKVPIKSNKTSEVSKKRPSKKQPQEKPLKNELVRSLTPLTPHRLPPISQNGTKSITGDEGDATPVILKELRKSRRFYEENIENEDLVTTPIVKWSGSRTLLWLVDCPSDNVSESSNQSTDSSPGEFDDDVSESSNQSTDSSPGEFDDDVSESSYQSTDSSPGESHEDISESSYQSTDSSPGESTDDVSESSDQSTDTSSAQTDVWDGEFDPVAIKYYRSLTPVHIEWKPPPKKRILSPISRVGCGKVSNAVSPSWRIESPLMTSTPFPRKDNEKDEKFLDRSARDKLCRMEVSRGFKVRKEIRMAMDEQGMQWESEFKSDIKITEETYRVQRSVDSNKQMVQNELDGLRERLRQAEEKDKLKSKDKSFCSSKFKTYFKSKKAGSDEKKERKETTDEYFRKTEEKFSRYVSPF
ncbi:hypothetical protein LOTGIDRAFT_170876 [Lottia gigantea]|uniref:Uncharacterized protein n=1 Tax=Lottia gigantea TaxID=225164 RepID=V4AJN4_LOTGI|nr:hypothetical protein LOTGIDRAFT_170876 [Lottia gigantea]ESP04374.1 hypothetical protein LOTGIDRAFT_170876 [Lottia gigantea]